MLARKAVVEPEADQVVEERAGSDAAEMSEIRSKQGRARDSTLIVALIVGEEK